MKQTKKQPLVSILLPVFNAGRFLGDCLTSIDNQTYKNFELIAIDDHSIDNSFQILKSFAKNKPWVKIYRNPTNLGVSPTFNKAISLAKGQFLARIDADDIMFPHRLELQVNYLQKHPKTVMVGGQCLLIDGDNKIIGQKTFPKKNSEIKDMLFKTVPMQQPTIMINRHLLPDNFCFSNSKFSPAEDFGLFFSANKYGRFANLSQYTHFYREHTTNISLVKPKKTFWKIWLARLDAIFNQNYHPSLRSIITVIAQTLAIIIVPEKFIYPLHRKMRKMESPKIKLESLPPIFLTAKNAPSTGCYL
jgi:glycosyltransferase involved in cell wall biosynthesis